MMETPDRNRLMRINDIFHVKIANCFGYKINFSINITAFHLIASTYVLR